jgi:hypothetical protein
MVRHVGIGQPLLPLCIVATEAWLQLEGQVVAPSAERIVGGSRFAAAGR